MNISVICACKNREESLKISLQSWLCFEQIKEIIIVDWSSDQSLSYLVDIDERIKVIRVENQKYFNLSQPLNLAAKFSTQDYILKMDCDYILNPYHSFFDNYDIDENSFISGNHNVKPYEYWNGEGYGIDLKSMHIVDIYNYVVTYTHYFKYLKGMLFVNRKAFEKIGGFNENIDNYGWEDSDIIHRLELLGLEHKKIDYDHSLIHIPHPDRKRFENCKIYDPQEEEDLKKQISPEVPKDRAQWEIEYFLSHKYIGENKSKFVELKEPYVIQKFEWEIQKINQQYHIAKKMSKLDNFPSVYYISLEESKDRQKNIEDQFGLYGVKVKSIISKRFSECNDQVTGPLVNILDDGTKGCVVSHLKMIQKWYHETDEDYAFFCEDDLSLETVDYWNFTWEEFVKNLPKDYECVQLCCVRPDSIDIKLRERSLYDWSVTAYIITRSYAKKIIDRYCLENSYHLEIVDPELYPMPESVLFYGLGKVYSINLFVEDQKLKSTFTEINGLETGQKEYHTETYHHVIEWWKKNGKTANIIPKEDATMKKYEDELQKLLTNYALDPDDPETNFQLALWYEKENHTAPALSYFLRCAERTTDKDFAYVALIKAHYCYERQGTRDTTAKTLLQHALCLLPRRPEAYFLAARFHEKRHQWQDSYIYAHLGLETSDFNQPELKADVDYPGKYGLLFQKALAGYWWEKVDEAKEIFLDLKNNYQMHGEYHKLVIGNLKTLGVAEEELENKLIEIKENQMDIVLQGTYDEFTDEVIREYISLPFVRNVIVSCWKDNKSNYYIDDRVEYIRNDYPLTPGTDNRNLQILSSLSGINRVKTDLSAKMRTDQKYDYDSMLKMYEYFIKNSSDKQIFVGGIYPDLLFHPRDHIFWGKTSDLKHLFNIPLEYGGFSDKVRIGKDKLWQYYSYFIRSETYIGAHYCSQFNDKINTFLLKPELYLYDNAPNIGEAKQISDQLTFKYFKSFPRTEINFSWPKKGMSQYPYDDQKKYYNECWSENGY